MISVNKRGLTKEEDERAYKLSLDYNELFYVLQRAKIDNSDNIKEIEAKRCAIYKEYKAIIDKGEKYNISVVEGSKND